LKEDSVLRVDILAAPETAGSVLYGLYDVLMLPGAAWPRVVLGESATPLTTIRIVARTTTPFDCRGGVPVSPHVDLNDATDADVVCVPNMTVPVDQCPYGWFADEVAWLKSRYRAGATIATVCSGALLLAEAGLLVGEEVTAHWAYEKTFRDFYPDVKFCPERILTFAGDGDQIVLAGGMSSWQDLAVYLIARFLGPEHAVQASKFYVISGHADGQLPYAALSRRIQSEDHVIAECQIWLRDNYATPDAVAKMQDLSGLPRRTFSRRFRTATGYTPIEYVQAVRMEEAKQLLETTVLPIEAVAAEVGYHDERAFRRVFGKRTGLSPSAYRKRFHHSRFSSRH
jgi:transcriptional regulator GlxA family with amidase domain